jgi:phage baseplate assembly protein W
MTIDSGIHGTGWPWNVAPEWQSNDQLVNSQFRSVLFTTIKERKMNIEYGGQLIKMIFENKGPLLQALARREIMFGANKFLPQLTVLNIDIVEPEKDNEPVDVTIHWEYLGVQGVINLSGELP